MRFIPSIRKKEINLYNVALMYSHTIYLLICCAIVCLEPLKNELFNCSYSNLSVASEFPSTSIPEIPRINDSTVFKSENGKVSSTVILTVVMFCFFAANVDEIFHITHRRINFFQKNIGEIYKTFLVLNLSPAPMPVMHPKFQV